MHHIFAEFLFIAPDTYNDSMIPAQQLVII
jgi:hypothetical protein